MIREEKLDVPAGDGLASAFLFSPIGVARSPALLMFTDAAGIRPSMLKVASRLAERGCHVLMPNLYYRHEPYAPLDIAQVFAHGPDWQRMQALRDGLRSEDVANDAHAYLAWLAEREDVRADRIGCLGLSLGGRFAIAAAGLFPEHVALALSVHGGHLVTTQSDSPHLLAARARGFVYIAAAESDAQLTPEHLQTLGQTLQAWGVQHTIDVFAGTKHGFGTAESAAYDEVATVELWRRIDATLKREQFSTDSIPGRTFS